MIIDTNLEEAKLTVALDIRHPYAFLALGPAIALGRELDIAINWLPRAGDPLRAPSTPGPNDDRGIRHRRSRALMIAREIAVYAQAQDLKLEAPYRNDPADAAHMAFLYMRDMPAHGAAQLEPFLVEIFRLYWSQKLNANDPNEVAAVVANFGASANEYLKWSTSQGVTALEQVVADLDEVGAVSAPSYLACGQAFQGRQHLPMIRWLLEGETGPVPI
jgi:2-hydroxychromene-2-carboxylate isomerase